MNGLNCGAQHMLVGLYLTGVMAIGIGGPLIQWGNLMDWSIWNGIGFLLVFVGALILGIAAYRHWGIARED